MQWLKQSTASTVYVGPVLDSAGAAVTTAVLADFRLVKNGTAATLTGATVTHDANGYYTVALTTTNTNTVGMLTIGVGNTAMAMATHNYIVLLASVYDALITNATNATGGLPAATGSISALAGAISTYAGGAVASVTGSVGSIATGGISAASFAAGAIDAAAIATDAIGSNEISAAAVTKIQAGLATPTNITAGTLTTVTNLTNLPAITANWLTAAGLAADAVAEIQSGLATPTNITAGTITTATNLTNLPSIPANWLTAAGIAASALNGKGDWNTTAPDNATIAAIAGYVDTEVAAIKAKTDNLPASPAAVGSAMTLTSGERTSIADATLGRSVATIESTAAEWSLASLILAAFESSISGTTWTIKRTDGTTLHLTKTVSTDAAADPIVGVS